MKPYWSRVITLPAAGHVLAPAIRSEWIHYAQNCVVLLLVYKEQWVLAPAMCLVPLRHLVVTAGRALLPAVGSDPGYKG